jgi:hypothetical protein
MAEEGEVGAGLAQRGPEDGDELVRAEPLAVVVIVAVDAAPERAIEVGRVERALEVGCLNAFLSLHKADAAGGAFVEAVAEWMVGTRLAKTVGDPTVGLTARGQVLSITDRANRGFMPQNRSLKLTDGQISAFFARSCSCRRTTCRRAAGLHTALQGGAPH